MPRSAVIGLEADGGNSHRLEEVQAARRCAVGAETDADPTPAHLGHLWRPDHEIAHWAVGSAHIPLGIEVDLVGREQDRVRGMDVGAEETKPSRYSAGRLPQCSAA